MRATATGFPLVVQCDWQPKSNRSIVDSNGRKIKLDALVYTDTYKSGLVGDIVTSPSGTQHIVTSVEHRQGNDGSYDHSVYGMSTSQQGAAQ